jgi:hypothetical protein
MNEELNARAIADCAQKLPNAYRTSLGTKLKFSYIKGGFGPNVQTGNLEFVLRPWGEWELCYYD